MTIIFHGDVNEARALGDAIARNCGCEFGLLGVRLSTCAAHLALVDDQRFVDHVIFHRRISDRLWAEEWNVA